MSNKTNDERLRILKERLTEIKQQKDPLATPKKLKEEIVVEEPEIESTTRKKSRSLNWLKYVAIIGAIGYGVFYAYNHESKLTNSNSLKSEKNEIKEKPELIEETLKYNATIKGHNIILSTVFKNEKAANIMKEELVEKGFKANYFFLPEKSNSKEEVYKIFIGPYENEEEKSQWAKNLKIDFEILIP